MGRAKRREREGRAEESAESRQFRESMREPPPRAVRARVVGQTMLIEPVFDAEPNYRECIDYLLRQHAAEIEAGIAKGGRYTIEVCHDNDCPALTEGCCNCDCEVNLVCLEEPRED